ncbi:tail fiber assembly protein, partial [Escherichia coli]|nr:tail fiber assembly protein [Escherichia coli]
EAEETKNSLMQVASEHIAPLQDAADLEIATEEERSLLEAWNKYRVLLNRVDTSVALGMKLFVTHVTVTVITISKVQNVY